MSILLIDNGTSYLSELKELLSGQDFQVSKYSEFEPVLAKSADAVILSGGHDFPVVGNEAKFQKEIDLVKNSSKPIFGICFGFEVIAKTFGARLELMPKREKGIVDIQVSEPDEIFLGISGFQVFESHRWVIADPADDLIVLARSKDGVEAIKHKTRPIYAVQFHPEMFVEKTCGDEIFRNFINLALKKFL